MTDQASKGETPLDQLPAAFMSNGSPAGVAMDTAEETRAAGMDAMGAALAHELNQPLTALMLYLQSLKRIERGSGSLDSRELLDKALNEAERATDIVRRMRRLSLRPEPDRRPVDLNVLCRDVIDLALLGVPRRPRLRTSLAPDLPIVQADPVQLRQVIVNLLRNAAEAAAGSKSPAVFLSTAVHDSAVQLTVADNGPGVDPQIASKLFRAFETSKSNGQGLGLAISRMIAQNHGGDVVMKSAAGEQGAVFALLLPLK
jgi:two-component system, LuxR family, sensor kinase FixL